MPSYMSIDATKHNGTARKTMMAEFGICKKSEKEKTSVNECNFLFEGDKLFYNDQLCEILEVHPDGVVVRFGASRKYIFCTDILNRKFKWRIEFTKDRFSGYEHTAFRDKAEKEKKLLESLGWAVKIYQVEVRL